MVKMRIAGYFLGSLDLPFPMPENKKIARRQAD
jgi:hypothetical protein